MLFLTLGIRGKNDAYQCLILLQPLGAAPHPFSLWLPAWSMERMPSPTAGPGRSANMHTSVSVFLSTFRPCGFSIWLLDFRVRGCWNSWNELVFFWTPFTNWKHHSNTEACSVGFTLSPSCSRSPCSMRRMENGGTLVGELWLLPTGWWLLLIASSMWSWGHKHKHTRATSMHSTPLCLVQLRAATLYFI